MANNQGILPNAALLLYCQNSMSEVVEDNRYAPDK
jgi:hypothetical protein